MSHPLPPSSGTPTRLVSSFADELQHRMSPLGRAAWRRWLDVAAERVHIGYEMLDSDVGRHTALCLEAALATAVRVRDLWLRESAPRRILEIGSSAGFKAFALSRLWPEAEVIGIDPDDRAIELAQALGAEPGIAEWIGSRHSSSHVIGVGEKLPWPDGHFDLVICLTTIEHVQDVEGTIAQIGRVLAPGGVAIIEAPNYLWPTEPHLGIVVPPLSPKWVMRLCARLQGQSELAWYVNHLQLVHPRRVEKAFDAAGFSTENLSSRKLVRVASGDTTDVVAHGRKAKLLATLTRLGLAMPLARAASTAGLYPSLLYRLTRRGP